MKRALIGLLIGALIPATAVAQTVQDGAKRTAITHSTIAVAVTSTEVVAANATRNFLILENVSDTNMDCKIGTAAVAGAGFRLYANGGSLLLDSKYPVAAINCIHAGSGTKSLLVSEGSQL